jgi:hypothetical protein
MRRSTSLLLACLACFAANSLAQVPEDVRVRLGPNGIVTAEGFIYASSTGVLRGARETSEDFQATRAMHQLVYALCDVQPATSRVIEASITGFTLVSSIFKGKEIEVIMRAPVQKPDCKAFAVAAFPSDISTSPAEAGPGRPKSMFEGATDLGIKPSNPSYTRSKDITVRIFGGEY